ncbi:uncharacterized protein [Montipora capricornis]|uniref:uncharacterized protein n=1 Tax=Montipora capricornis TaxID=246305 RepID=UPI0035F2104C
MSTKCDDLPSKRNSSSLEKRSRTSYDLRKRAKVSLTVSHPYESTPEVSPSEEKTIKDFEVPASGSQSTCWNSSLEFAPQSQEELKKIYRDRPLRCRRKSESWDSEESEEEEFTEEQWKQTEAHKLLLNYFVTIAKQLSTS